MNPEPGLEDTARMGMKRSAGVDLDYVAAVAGNSLTVHVDLIVSDLTDGQDLTLRHQARGFGFRSLREGYL